ncbi:serine hydrolase domain-containing protein [Sphingobacterium sp. LRF_L2]|uniref:serine hydrolase domain-containing protein n=1 Tax=Sphingobacterium sp. LRF_L2 TaxID=3369421 RepID=UPI003F62958A
MRRNLLTTLFTLISFIGLAQSQTELTNKAVFNKIEFFINTKMTDSIYNLSSENFKSQISNDQLAFVLNNLYQLGQIKQAELIDFHDNTATYLLQFPKHALQAKLQVNTDYRYDLLLFQAAEKSVSKQEDKTEVISNVERVDPTDFFIDSLANTYVKKGNAQSLSVAIFHNNKYKSFFYGETEKGNQTIPSENTLYEIGSISKVFTATLLADLVKKNTIHLEDSISKFLPDSISTNPSLKGITFQMLANHTSGLPRLADNWNTIAGFNAKDPYANYDRKALFSFLKNFKNSKTPGEEYEYSNLGFGLLGELLSIITKKPYIQLLQEVILTPLSLTNTTDKPDPKKQQVALKAYDEKGNETPSWNWKAMVGAGGLKSNVKDMMLFAVEEFKMPQTELQHAMGLTREFTFFTPNNTDIGLAWHISMLDGLIYFHHNGGTAGSSSFLAISPDTKTAVVVLSNAAESVDKVGVQMMEKLLEQSANQ